MGSHTVCVIMTAEFLAFSKERGNDLSTPMPEYGFAGLKPGELDMYIGYGGKDEFNVDAQVESFLYAARERGLEVGVGYLPNGRHNVKTVYQLFPGMVDWLAVRLMPFAPQ